MASWGTAHDPRTPLSAKVAAVVIAAYALSPIDLISEFIPVLCYLDDIVFMPLAIILAVTLIPATLLREC